MAKKLKDLGITRWDVTDYLKTEEDMAAYIGACIDEAPDDPVLLAKALGEVARARGMSQLARDAGMSRESLYKALSPTGNPSLATALKVTRALGLRIKVEKAAD
jgi:probable addiction module antidote protein